MVPPSTPPPNIQPIQQFLSTVLSQRGPTALPYSEDTKWLIREQLVYLITAFPSLEPKTATYTHNDGRSVHLLKADGTIPMPYHGTTYNIPIIIWLLDSFPRHPPCVYVNPTRDMIIKRPHSHVNPSGLVSFPYLQNWVYPTSNLVDLCKQLSVVFSHDPPLYSQRRNPNPSPSPSPSHNPNLNPSLSSFGAYPTSRPVNRPNPSPSPSPYPPSPYGGGRVGGQSQTDDAAEVYRRNAVNKIVEMVHNDVEQMRSLRQVEMEGLLSAQAALKAREEMINKGVKELQDEKEGLEAQLQVVLMNADVLEGWVRENEGKLKEKFDGGVNVDDVFECADVLSKQMLECAAADLAIEDVVYSLDKAVQDGAVPFDQYLRNVRLLSREQFFHRATAAKVRAAQMQAQVASMAARVPHYAS